MFPTTRWDGSVDEKAISKRALTFAGHPHPKALPVATVTTVIAHAWVDGAHLGRPADVGLVLLETATKKLLQ